MCLVRYSRVTEVEDVLPDVTTGLETFGGRCVDRDVGFVEVFIAVDSEDFGVELEADGVCVVSSVV